MKLKMFVINKYIHNFYECLFVVFNFVCYFLFFRCLLMTVISWL